MKKEEIASLFRRDGRRAIAQLMLRDEFWSSPKDILLDTAFKAYRASFHQECLRLISAIQKRARRGHPGIWSLDLEYLRGDTLLDLGRYAAAVRCYTEILKHDKTDIAFSNRALSLWELGKYQDALHDYMSALSLNRSNPIAQRGAGEMRLKLGDPRSSIRHFESAIKNNAEYVDAWAGLGVAFFQVGEWGKSYRAFQEAVRLDPKCDLAKKGLLELDSRLCD